MTSMLIGSRLVRTSTQLLVVNRSPYIAVDVGRLHSTLRSTNVLLKIGSNGSRACSNPHGDQGLLLGALGHRILLVEAWRRGFKQKYIMAHQKRDNPGRKYEYGTSLNSLFAISLFCIVIYSLVDIDYVIQTYMPSRFSKNYNYVCALWKQWWRKFLRVDAASIPKLRAETESTEDDDAEENEGKAEKKHLTFRERKIIEYENRIRAFSTPDKIFRYFATIKLVHDEDPTNSEIFMTPDDFLRALTPGHRQPDDLGLDQFKRIDITSKEAQRKLAQDLPKDSVFYKLSDYGLINFSDFVFLLTVLSVSKRHFEIAFRMFDLNGDGNVDYEEFEKVQNAILEQTSIGQKLGHSIKQQYYRGVSSALSKYFFGVKLNQKLTIDKFLDFQTKLQKEMLTLEFKGKHPVDGKITESQFSELLVAYGNFSESKKSRMLKRVKRAFPKIKEGDEVDLAVLKERGITMDDYLGFFDFLQNITDVDIALTFFNMAGAGIDKETLKHAAKTVAHINLRDHLVDVIFTLFDENQDGSLSNREFISVMKERLRRGLARPKDTGFVKITNALWNALKIDGIFL